MKEEERLLSLSLYPPPHLSLLHPTPSHLPPHTSPLAMQIKDSRGHKGGSHTRLGGRSPPQEPDVRAPDPGRQPPQPPENTFLLRTPPAHGVLLGQAEPTTRVSGNGRQRCVHSKPRNAQEPRGRWGPSPRAGVDVPRDRRVQDSSPRAVRVHSPTARHTCSRRHGARPTECGQEGRAPPARARAAPKEASRWEGGEEPAGAANVNFLHGETCACPVLLRD